MTDDDGVWKTRTIQRKPRKPKDERWMTTNSDVVKVCSWATKEENDKDRDIAAALKMQDDELEVEKQAPGEEVMPRNFYTSAKNLEDHGFSSGCQGCLSILRGRTRQAHSAACRKRFEGILAESDKVKRMSENITEYLAKMLEKDDDERNAKNRRRRTRSRRPRPRRTTRGEIRRASTSRKRWPRGRPAEKTQKHEEMTEKR